MFQGLLIVLFLLSVRSVMAQDLVEVAMQDGIERTYHLHVPENYIAGNGLVIALHDYASSGQAMAAITDLNQAADEHGFIAVYPDSLDLYWDAGQIGTGWPLGSEPVDDVGFILQLLDNLQAKYETDAVYVTGFGQGGALAYRLACVLPERVTAVAVVGALLWDYHVADCGEASAPVTMLIAVGTEDLVYPLEGRTVNTAGSDARLTILSAAQTTDFWLKRNDCQTTATDVIELQIHDDCMDGTQIIFSPIVGGGHMWLRNGPYTLNQIGVDVTDMVVGFFMGADDWGTDSSYATDAELFGGMMRTYRTYVPPTYDPTQSTPLVIALHGRPDNGSGIAYRLDMNRIAREQGFIVAYPDGIDLGWNYTRDAPLFPDNPIDDDAFIAAMVADLAVDLNVDRERVYVTGFSNGGFMTERLACVAADTYAAFAVVGAAFSQNFAALCADATPVPILFMHGTDDPSIPWEGAVVADIQLFLSVPDTIAAWTLINDCDNTPAETVLPQRGESPGTQVHRFDFADCAPDSDLVFYGIIGGGHNLPGVPGRIGPQIAREVNMDIHAGEVIWEFVSQFTLSD